MRERVARPVRADLEAGIPGRFGSVRQVVAVGSRPGTYIVATGERRLVAKRLDAGRSPDDLRRLHDALERAGIPSPRLLEVVELSGETYALHAYLEGTPPALGGDGWARAWEDAFELLARLREVPVALSHAPDTHWLERVAGTAAEDPRAAGLRAELLATPVAGARTLAHGDFAPQNFLSTTRGLALLDWEEAGLAPAGFDAGWLLAMNRLGAGPRLPRRELRERLLGMGWEADALRCFEGLGLLRMHHRVSVWLNGKPEIAPLLDRLGGEIADLLRAG